MNQPLTFVAVGCGGRSKTYCELAALHPHRYRIIAAADPNPAQLKRVREVSRNPEFRSFSSDAEMFSAGKLADICIIGTQDAYHVAPAMRAMELGYDVLLEKPIATNPEEILKLEKAADRLGRKIMVCHVLRFGPFYTKVKEILDSGMLGDIITLDAREGVGPWHQTNSYVRGHWADTGKSTPMLLAKSCHDLDIISWIMDRACERVGSFGRLTHFTPANRPEGAPPRCTDACPVADSCSYNAMHYAGKHRIWLAGLMDGAAEADVQEIADWLATSPWGRCVYACENDAVDHQVVMMEFEGGGTATFTMTAFDYGRDLVICGTRGRLRGGDNTKALSGHDIVVTLNNGDAIRYGVTIPSGGYEGHGGADPAMVQALDSEFAKPAREMRTGLPASVESHFIGFAAEESRRAGKIVELADFRRSLGAGC